MFGNALGRERDLLGFWHRSSLREKVGTSVAALGVTASALGDADTLRPARQQALDVFGHELVIGGGAGLAVLALGYMVVRHIQSDIEPNQTHLEGGEEGMITVVPFLNEDQEPIF